MTEATLQPVDLRWRQDRPSGRRRRRQLTQLAVQLEELFGANGDRRLAREFARLAVYSDQLLTDGFAQQDLNDVSALMPGQPDWLNPKCGEYDGPRSPWQLEAAGQFARCEAAALSLRVIGRARW